MESPKTKVYKPISIGLVGNFAELALPAQVPDPRVYKPISIGLVGNAITPGTANMVGAKKFTDRF